MNPQDMLIPQQEQAQIGSYIQAKLAQLQQQAPEEESPALDKFIASKGLQPGNVTYIPKGVPKMDGSGEGRGCGVVMMEEPEMPPMMGQGQYRFGS